MIQFLRNHDRMNCERTIMCRPCVHIAILNVVFFLIMSPALNGQNLHKASGFGPSIEDIQREVVVCVTDEQYEQIFEQVSANVADLKKRGIIKKQTNRSIANLMLTWPMRQADGFGQFSYYATNNFVDLDTTSGILDYNCGSRTYNGHKGTDYNIWPFWWDMMADNQVEIIAAAPGIIVYKTDNNYDQSCTSGGSWNAIFVRHADGSAAFYGHMKTGSLTTKGLGDTVERGEYLGRVGSSGNSSNPHLHFEIRDSMTNVVDPYDGTCNDTNDESLWLDQKPYREPSLNTMTTHSAAPLIGNFCPGVDQSNASNTFNVGDVVYFLVTLHDQEIGDTLRWEITYPNGDTLYSHVFLSPGTYNQSWWYWGGYTMPSNSFAEGVWHWTGHYNDSTIVHPFIMGCPDALVVDEEIIPTDTYVIADSMISTNGPVNVLAAPDGAIFKAGNNIQLNALFEVKKGATFEALIDGCP
jgi:murein DD-endopeptidase MepM/ murein hydrolase activator NlpD